MTDAFIIIALGESIVAIGVGSAGLPLNAGVIVAALLGITVVACLWWLPWKRPPVPEEGAGEAAVLAQARTHGAVAHRRSPGRACRRDPAEAELIAPPHRSRVPGGQSPTGSGSGRPVRSSRTGEGWIRRIPSGRASFQERCVSSRRVSWSPSRTVSAR
jgi:hypothetical protein